MDRDFDRHIYPDSDHDRPVDRDRLTNRDFDRRMEPDSDHDRPMDQDRLMNRYFNRHIDHDFDHDRPMDPDIDHHRPMDRDFDKYNYHGFARPVDVLHQKLRELGVQYQVLEHTHIHISIVGCI